jgi:hypothetical protein
MEYPATVGKSLVVEVFEEVVLEEDDVVDDDVVVDDVVVEVVIVGFSNDKDHSRVKF